MNEVQETSNLKESLKVMEEYENYRLSTIHESEHAESSYRETAYEKMN